MAFTPDHLPIRILCVEDDEAHAELISSYIRSFPFPTEILIATSAEEARSIVACEPIDAIVLDYHLPDGSGLDLIEKLSPEGGPPVIVVSGVGSERVAVMAMKMGAADYLKKDLDLSQSLPRSLLEAFERRSRKIEKRRATRELELLAFTDQLTGLRNRRFFEDVYDREFSASKRYGHPLSLLIVDFDHFKNINDTYGHQFGDRVLTESAQRLQEMVRVSDLVARYGGEEIVALLPCTTVSGAEILSERLLASVSALPFQVNGQPFRVTLSGGLATYTSGPIYSNAAKLFAAADAALYRAKSDGRNRLIVAPPDGPPVPETKRPSRNFSIQSH